MIFFKKVKRVIDVEKAEADFEERMKDVELDNSDRKAMIIAGFIVFVPVLLFILATFGLGIWFFFGRYI